MTEYVLNSIHEHLILETGSTSLLLDTGAPSSLCNRNINLCDRVFQVQDQYLGVSLEWLIEQTGCQIDGLLGMDILSEFTMELDVARNRIRFDEKINGEGATIPVTSIMGIPVIKISIEGNEQQVFFDTGAQLSYADPLLMTGMEAVGEMDDFYPGFGNFKTSVYNLNTRLAGKNLTCSYGILPELLRSTLMMAGTSGILGNEILQEFRCTLNMRENFMFIISVDA